MNRVLMSDVLDVPLNLSNEIIDLTGDSPVVDSTQRRGPRPRHLFQDQRIDNYFRGNLPQNSPVPIFYDALTSVDRNNSYIQIIDPDEAQIRVHHARNGREFGDVNSASKINEEYSRAVPCMIDSCSGEQVVLSCPICFEPLTAEQKPMATRCGHVYCAQCLENALERSSKKLCSKCNAPVKMRSCIRLYF